MSAVPSNDREPPVPAARRSGGWALSAEVSVELRPDEVVFRVRHRAQSWLGLLELLATLVALLLLAVMAFVLVQFLSAGGFGLVGAAVVLLFLVPLMTVSLPTRLVLWAGEERIHVRPDGVEFEWRPRRLWGSRVLGRGAGGRFRLESGPRGPWNWLRERWDDFQGPGTWGALWLVAGGATEPVRFGLGMTQRDLDRAWADLGCSDDVTLVVTDGKLSYEKRA